jgi:predicted transcriptional regulator
MGVRSDSSAYKFLNELIDCGLLMKRSRQYYWINPFMFFPGTVSVRYLYYKERFREVARDKYPDVYVKHYL